MERSDDDLIAHAAGGDGDALALLLERHGPVVRRRIAGDIPRRWRAMIGEDDVLQQTWVDAFRDVGAFRPQGLAAFTGWLTTIAKRNLVDAIRMLEAEKRGGGRRRVTQAREDSCADLFERLGGVTRGPSRVAARAEACDVLGRAIEALPADYRRVVELYDLEQKPVDEVAAAVGRSAGAVYMLRARAHRLLGERMGTASKYLTTP
jgi:RNA polymerase sigma factor (sigma-70 family)